MTEYFQRTEPKKWNLNDAHRSFGRVFSDVDNTEAIKRELHAIITKSQLKLKRDLAAQLLAEVECTRTSNAIGESSTATPINNLHNTNNGQQVFGSVQNMIGTADSKEEVEGPEGRSRKRNRAGDPMHDFFNPTSGPQQDEGSLLPDLPAPLQDIDDVSIGKPPELPYYVGEKNIAPAFFEYKKRAKKMLSEQKMFQETNLLELLALTHVLLLKQWEYSSDMIKFFTIRDLNAAAVQVKEYFCGKDVEFDKDVKEALQNKLEEINTPAETLDDISDGVNDIARMARQKGLTKEAQIVRGFRNIIETFPPAGIMNEIPEMDLITSFLAPFLTPLLQSSNSRLRWPNTKLDTLRIANRPTSHRPDCLVSKLIGVKCTHSVLYGEVKSEEHAHDNFALAKDLLRLAVFGKDGVDANCMEGMIVYQAVGHTITFYGITLVSDGMYAMAEIAKINVPKSVKDLPTFTSSLTALKAIMRALERCRPVENPDNFTNMKRDTLDTPHFKSIINTIKEKRRGSFVSFA